MGLMSDESTSQRGGLEMMERSGRRDNVPACNIFSTTFSAHSVAVSLDSAT